MSFSIFSNPPFPQEKCRGVEMTRKYACHKKFFWGGHSTTKFQGKTWKWRDNLAKQGFARYIGLMVWIQLPSPRSIEL